MAVLRLEVLKLVESALWRTSSSSSDTTALAPKALPASPYADFKALWGSRILVLWSRLDFRTGGGGGEVQPGLGRLLVFCELALLFFPREEYLRLVVEAVIFWVPL